VQLFGFTENDEPPENVSRVLLKIMFVGVPVTFNGFVTPLIVIVVTADVNCRVAPVDAKVMLSKPLTIPAV
jgi:hypothetical protein